MKYCYECGNKLETIKKSDHHWLIFYKCPSCFSGYIEVGDTKWIFSLVQVSSQIIRKIDRLPLVEIEKHTKLIKQIDCKTISTAEFENAITSIKENG